MRLTFPDSVRPEGSRIVLQGPVAACAIRNAELSRIAGTLIPLLDGTRSRAGVLAKMPPNDAEAAAGLLDLLARSGLLDEERPILPEPVAAQLRLAQLLGLAPDTALARLSGAAVLLHGAEAWSSTLRSELVRAGIGRVATTSDMGEQAVGDWTLMLDLTPFFAAERRTATIDALNSGVPVLAACLRGSELLLGPLAAKRGGPCGACLRDRMLACEDALAPDPPSLPALGSPTAADFGAMATLAPMATLAAGLVATEVVRRVLGLGQQRPDDEVAIWNALSGTCTTHRVVAMPQCRVCGGAVAGAPLPQSFPEASRWSDPEDVARALPGWVDSRTGIIAGLSAAHVPPLHGVTTRLAHPNDGQRWLGITELASGKAATFGDAASRAVAEAVERYSAMVLDPARLRYAAMDALEGDVLDPHDLCLYTADQYATPGFPFVAFDPAQIHPWCRGTWLDGGPVWAPALAVHLAGAGPGEPAWCQTTSNGLAAGASFDEAAQRAVLELLERDTLMTAWLTRLPLPEIIPDDSLGPLAAELLEEVRREGGTVALHLDLSRPVAVAACVARGDGARWPGLTVGAGADPSPRAALRKAVVEHGFSARTWRGRLRAGTCAPAREAVRSFADHALYRLPAARAVAADFLREGRPMPLSDVAEPVAMDFAALKDALVASGTRIALVDVTAPELRGGPLQVVRAIGPHLQPVFCGYGRHRMPGARARALLAGRAPNPDLPPFS